MRNSRGRSTVLVMAVLAASAASAQPIPGAADLRFGVGGQVQTADPVWRATVAGAVAVDRLGRIVVGGGTLDGTEYLTVLRYLPNGALDQSFGTSGLVRTKTAPTSGTNHAKAIVIQPDGKILAAGIGLDPSATSQFGAALVRYLADGALDPAFGANGIAVTPLGTFTSGADALALQSDGRIVVAATRFNGPTTDDDVVVLRYTPDGVLDPSFGTGGVVNLTIAGEQWARGVAVTATGRILVSARTSNGTLLARLRSTGELDDSFGGTTGVVGIAGVPGEGLVLQPNGRIVVPGMAAGGTLGAARYASTGPADPAFGSAGVAGSGFSGGGDDAAIQENGKIVVVGGGGPFLRQYPLLWRAHVDGTADAGFQAIGPSAPGSPRAFFTAVALQPDGKIVAVGRADPDGQAEHEAFLVARFHGDPTDLIFKDGFDLGSFVAWSASATADDNLMVEASSALKGTAFGLRAFVDDVTPLFAQDDSPHDEDRYRARFYLDPGNFDPGEARDHRRMRTFIVFSESPGRRLAAIVLRRLNGAYAVMGRARLDDNSQVDTGWTALGSGPHGIELDLKRSSAEDANDGWFRLWVDGALVADLGALDNHLSAVDFVRLGALSVKSGAAGTVSWDEFESRRESPIGP